MNKNDLVGHAWFWSVIGGIGTLALIIVGVLGASVYTISFLLGVTGTAIGQATAFWYVASKSLESREMPGKETR